MLERVPTVLTAQEILDKAFQRALKIDIPDPVRYHRIRKTEAARMQSVCDTISETLVKWPQRFPNLDHERDYDVEVLDIVMGLHKLRKSLGSIKWAAEKVQDIKRQTTERMAQVRTVEGIKQAQNACYGRISSIVKDVDKDLTIIAATREAVKQLPTVSPDYATIVVAGYPNVGKTSLLRSWTESRAEIAGYAFTTKHAEVGHFEVESRPGHKEAFQVVDTPGLLDRPEEKRNDVEKQALAALRLAADAVLFILDPSQTCGYDIEAQEHLLGDVRTEMAGLPLLVAESKCDLVRRENDHLKFSTTTGEGLDGLQQAVVGLLTEAHELAEDLEEDPLDKWRAMGAQD
ncbi:MAG: NOG1 family protein [Thermoplasmatota archaeon]